MTGDLNYIPNLVKLVKPETKSYTSLKMEYCMRPRWGSNPNVPENLAEGLYPVYVSSIIEWRGKLQPAQWPQLMEKSRTKSLRQVAREYGVSHESIRRILNAAPSK